LETNQFHFKIYERTKYLEICGEASNCNKASNIFLPSSSSLCTLRYLLVSGMESKVTSALDNFDLGSSESCNYKKLNEPVHEAGVTRYDQLMRNKSIEV